MHSLTTALTSTQHTATSSLSELYQVPLPPEILAATGIAKRFNITHETTLRAAVALYGIEKGATLGHNVGLFFNADPGHPDSLREHIGGAVGTVWGANKGRQLSQRVFDAGKNMLSKTIPTFPLEDLDTCPTPEL